ncbi:MAG: DUF3849 domain-containing protein [Clostridia bacterium]|nr:DUF3849 domain-containing protein [Clostridia bacterium]
MTNKLKSDGMYDNEKTSKLYEIKKSYVHSAVIYAYPEKTSANYSVITKPYISNGRLEWRSKYDSYTYANAIDYAKELNNMYAQVENNRTVAGTAADIDKNINNSMKELYHYDLQQAYSKTAENHSEFDIALTVALTIHKNNWDGRFSAMNKAWAENFIQTNKVNTDEFQQFYGCSTHPALLDGFTDTVRKNISSKSIKQLQGNGEVQDLTDTISHEKTR